MFDPLVKNYSFQQVEIPAGTVVEKCNFAQLLPGTECISTDGLITLKNCNLLNVKLKPEWEIIECLTTQAWLISVILEDGTVTTDRQFICTHSSDLIGDEVAPDNAILVMDF